MRNVSSVHEFRAGNVQDAACHDLPAFRFDIPRVRELGAISAESRAIRARFEPPDGRLPHAIFVFRQRVFATLDVDGDLANLGRMQPDDHATVRWYLRRDEDGGSLALRPVAASRCPDLPSRLRSGRDTEAREEQHEKTTGKHDLR